ncbi:MAG: membrane protein insertase YidC [Deltaproteobacteria bacterium]|nr:MAG: membrane protein insertase YidC [Deltaproteobacteria bacterium]
MNTTEQNKRLLLAVVLSGGLLLVWQAFMVPPPLEQAPEGAAETAEAEEGAPPPTAPTTVAPADDGTAEEPAAEVEALPLQAMRTPNLALEFSNVGARLARVEILEPAQYIPKEDMRGIFPEATGTVLPGEMPHLPLSFDFPAGTGPGPEAVYAFDEEASRRGVDGWEHLVYRWSGPGGLEVERAFHLHDLAFGIRSSLTIRHAGDAPLTIDGLRSRLYGEFDGRSGGMLNPGASIVEAVCRVNGRMERRHGIKVEETREYSGPVDFVGVNERYFLSALIPHALPDGVRIEGCRFQPAAPSVVAGELIFEPFVVPPGEAGVTLDFTAYVGPKDASFLRPFESRLEQTIDLGWMSFLALPIRWLLLFFQGFVVNWGLAIILLTFFIKLLLTPLTHKSFKSMEKMREIGPKLQELKKKYENDPTKMAEAQMKLFRESGVNPLGGCLPMLLQMPIYIALYQTIWGSAELYNAPFILWITDLSQRDPYYLLPLLMGGVMYVQQQLMPTTVDNPQMRLMQKIMPVMFTVFMLWLPSGLVLYIFVNMLLSIAHQLYLRKTLAKAQPASAK